MWSAPSPAIHESTHHFLAVDPRERRQTAELIARLRERAACQPVPDDWCYVHQFAAPDTPRAIALPPGGGRRLQQGVDRCFEALRAALHHALHGETHVARRRELAATLSDREQRALAVLRARARERDVGLVREAARIVIVPLQGGAPLAPEKLTALPKADRARRVEDMARIAHELELILRDFRLWAREADDAADDLDASTARAAVGGVLDPLRASYATHPGVLEYLAGLERDVIEHAHELADLDAPGVESDAPAPLRYRVRVIVDHSGESGAPVIYEPRPTYAGLVGRADEAGGDAAHWIQPGALHRAAGGYLVLDAREVARHASVRLAIERTIRSAAIRVESLTLAMGVAKRLSGSGPDPIPFGETTIVLTGSAGDYERLAAVAPALCALFAPAG